LKVAAPRRLSSPGVPTRSTTNLTANRTPISELAAEESLKIVVAWKSGPKGAALPRYYNL